MSTARKAVTILFCDVSGSTAPGEELDPESLREVIQRYFTEMRAVIERHGGTVEKFIGEPPSAEDAQARIASILPAAQRAVVERLAAILGSAALSVRSRSPSGPFEGASRAWRPSARWCWCSTTSSGQRPRSSPRPVSGHVCTRHPILLLCLARPELLEMRPDWGELSVVIRLEPLQAEESKRLVGDLLGEWSGPEEVPRQIVDGAGGNPLFIEEMLRMLVDDGVLARENGRWVARGELSRLGASDTVHAVIAARLDRLDPADRDVLRASVAGEVFWWGAVAGLSDDSQTDVGRSLQALVRTDLMRPERRRRPKRPETRLPRTRPRTKWFRPPPSAGSSRPSKPSPRRPARPPVRSGVCRP